jgi:beta-lactamase class A
MPLSRRDVITAAAGLLVAPLATRAQGADPSRALQALETRNGGRLGVAMLDTRTRRIAGHRLDERFAMCSTFKFSLAALVLREADQGRLALTERIAYTEKDLLPVSPVTTRHLKDGGASLGVLAEAAQVTSDNAAANLLLARLGGPAGFTAKLRALGDTTTRLDRNEPQLNLVVAGDERDTTTPRAMADTVARFVAGDALAPASRDRLIEWMVRTETGLKRIRAGLPKDWKAGDKTGTGMAAEMTDKYNDLAVAFPPGRAPLVVTAFYDTDEHATDMRDEDQAVLAEVGRLAAAW